MNVLKPTTWRSPYCSRHEPRRFLNMFVQHVRALPDGRAYLHDDVHNVTSSIYLTSCRKRVKLLKPCIFGRRSVCAQHNLPKVTSSFNARYTLDVSTDLLLRWPLEPEVKQISAQTRFDARVASTHTHIHTRLDTRNGVLGISSSQTEKQPTRNVGAP